MKRQIKETPYPQLIKPHGSNTRTGRAMDYKNQAANRIAFLMDLALQNVKNVARQSFQFPVPTVSLPKPLKMIEKLQLLDNEVKRELEKCKESLSNYLKYKNELNVEN